jgi:ComF family protein
MPEGRPQQVDGKGGLSRFAGLGRTLLDLLYPPLCRCCRALIPEHDGRNVCQKCWNGIEYLQEPLCLKCGSNLEDYLPEGRPCPRCPDGDIHFDRAVAVARYDGTMRECIHWFKYRFKKRMAESLGALMVQGVLQHYYAEPLDGVLPVPLHWTRLRYREFNQAELLAAPVAEARNVPLLNGVLIRSRRTKPQSSLKASGRKQKNIAGAFKVRRQEEVKDRKLLLIDDLYTSGSTVNECARVLKEAGAEQVNVLTLARTR